MPKTRNGFYLWCLGVATVATVVTVADKVLSVLVPW